MDGVDFTESLADRMFYSGTFGTYVFVRVVQAGDVEIALTNNLTGTDNVNADAWTACRADDGLRRVGQRHGGADGRRPLDQD